MIKKLERDLEKLEHKNEELTNQCDTLRKQIKEMEDIEADFDIEELENHADAQALTIIRLETKLKNVQNERDTAVNKNKELEEKNKQS